MGTTVPGRAGSGVADRRAGSPGAAMAMVCALPILSFDCIRKAQRFAQLPLSRKFMGLFDYGRAVGMLPIIRPRHPQGWRGVSASRRCHMHDQTAEIIKSAEAFDMSAGVGYRSGITPRHPKGLAGFFCSPEASRA